MKKELNLNKGNFR